VEAANGVGGGVPMQYPHGDIVFVCSSLGHYPWKKLAPLPGHRIELCVLAPHPEFFEDVERVRKEREA